MVSVVDLLVKSVAVLAGGLAMASFGGALHPAADTLAVGRLGFVALSALAVIWSAWPRSVRWPWAGLALVILGQTALAKALPGAAGDLSVYQRNLLYRNTRMEDVVAEIRRLAPEVITLQEVSRYNGRVLSMLRAEYPHQHLCRNQGWNGIAVLSRVPVVAGEAFCTPSRGLAGLRVAHPDGPVWVVSVHMSWPWPYGQGAQARQYAPLLEALDGPVVLSGDFNMPPWGASVRMLSDAAGTRRAGVLQPTYWFREGPLPVGLPLALDHVHAPGGGTVNVLPFLGSDHKGLFARVAVAP